MTQGEIEKLTAKTENIFSELEIRIMSDIVRRIIFPQLQQTGR